MDATKRIGIDPVTHEMEYLPDTDHQPTHPEAKDVQELVDFIWGHYYSPEKGVAEIERYVQARLASARAGYGDGSPGFEQTTDATKWARAFCHRFGGNEGLMIGWFANAIERGKDEAERKGEEMRAKADKYLAEAERAAKVNGGYISAANLLHLVQQARAALATPAEGTTRENV
jgi:hypothetical protein